MRDQSPQHQPQPPPPPYHYQDDEITLRELILKFKEFWQELWSKKVWIIATAGVMAAIFYAKTSREVTTYKAGVSFMVSENDNGDQGLNSPFGGLEIRIENNKITELARSGRIIHQVLLTKAVINTKNDYLANHIIDVYDLHERWRDEPVVEQYQSMHLKDFYFTRDDVDNFSRKELRALSVLQQVVVGNNLLGEKGTITVSFDDGTDLFRLNVDSKDENLSMRLIEHLFEELSVFYVDETIGRPQRTYEKLVIQTDSLNTALLAAEEALARGLDRNNGLTSNLSSINISRPNRQVSIAELEYNESFRNLKKMELLLSQETPEFQIIDWTFFPEVIAPSIVKAIALGASLGGFLASLFFLGRKVVNDAMMDS